VIDATNSPAQPARALELVEPAKRIVFIGLAGSPNLIDTRKMVLKDVTSVGILSASPGLAGTIDVYASAAFDPHQLVAATVGLEGISEILAGVRPEGAGMGPKMHIDPRI
jgi:threonine dehydrogenase-like Zn-dependent dehydrogenase